MLFISKKKMCFFSLTFDKTVSFGCLEKKRKRRSVWEEKMCGRKTMVEHSHLGGVGHGMRNARHPANGIQNVVDRCTTQLALRHVANSRAALAKRHVGPIAARLLGRRALRRQRRERLARMHLPRSTARRGLNWELPRSSRESTNWRHHHGRDACHVRDHLHIRTANTIEGNRKPVQICVADMGDGDLPSRSGHALADHSLLALTTTRSGWRTSRLARRPGSRGLTPLSQSWSSFSRRTACLARRR